MNNPSEAAAIIVAVMVGLAAGLMLGMAFTILFFYRTEKESGKGISEHELANWLDEGIKVAEGAIKISSNAHYGYNTKYFRGVKAALGWVKEHKWINQ